MSGLLKKLSRYFEEYSWAGVGNYSMYSGMGDEWPLLLAYQESHRSRKLFFAPIKQKNESYQGQEIRIHAEVDAQFGECCHFLCNQNLLPEYSVYFKSLGDAQDCPMAEEIFMLGGIDEIIIHDSIVTVRRDPAIDEDWHTMAAEVGQTIREHVRSGLPIVSPLFFQRVPLEDEIRTKVEQLIETEINPLLAEHQGGVYLERIKNNTIWLTMTGSCQGCAAAPLAFRHGIGQRLRRGIPFLGAIYDATEHAAGLNPYFQISPSWQEESYETA